MLHSIVGVNLIYRIYTKLYILKTIIKATFQEYSYYNIANFENQLYSISRPRSVDLEWRSNKIVTMPYNARTITDLSFNK